MGKVIYKEIKWNGRPVKVADWSALTHKEWEQWRAGLNKIGGSDVGTILGYNMWKDPLILFYEKIGIKPKFFKPNELTAGGHADEQGILDRLEHYDGSQWVPNYYAGKKFRRIEPLRFTFYSDEMPWLAYNADGVIYDDAVHHDKGMGMAEFKKIRGQYSDKFVGGVPVAYIPQLVTGMEVTGAWYGMIALLRDGVELIVRTFDRDMDDYYWWADQIHTACSRFYEAMLKGQEVVAGHGGKMSDELLNELLEIEAEYEDILYVSADDNLGSYYSELHNLRQERGTAQPDSELIELVARREKANEILTESKEERQLLDNKIRDWMRKRAAILAEDDKVRVGFRKNLTLKVKDDSIFFGL